MEVEEAIEQLKHGNINGLAVLVECYQLKAVRTAYLITQDREIAEDVTQTVFINLRRHIHQFDTSRPFAPWFMRIIVNAAIQAAKREQRTLSLETDMDSGDGLTFADLLADPSPDLETILEAQDMKQAVKDALNVLTPEQRAVIILRYYLGYDTQEISAEMETPQGTVKWRLHAARKQLQALLYRFKLGSSDVEGAING